MAHQHLISASREALDVTLKLKEGQVPDDLSGFVYINSGAGSVNSDGLPFPKTLPNGQPNKEFGAPVINGDGYMYRFDFTESGKVKLKTDIFKPPCYYADIATSPVLQGEKNPYADLMFKNMGLARLSMKLGTRNQLNTAITPFRLPNDEQARLLATFDAGRPFEFDPASLALISPVGPNTFWQAGTPPFLRNPFPMVLTTAHPVYDPETRELFTVNFTKTTKALMSATSIFDLLYAKEDELEQKLLERIERWEKLKDQNRVVKEVNDFFENIENEIEAPDDEATWWEKLVNSVMRFFQSKVSNPNAVYLIKWQGEKVPKKWQIVNEDGKGIQIMHNMHQIGFTRDYVLLADTNFKFTLNVMLNNPFPQNPKIDKFLRQLLSGAQLDYSSIYIVKRSELVDGVEKVKAKKVVIPTETVHFSANYENPKGIVTLHTAHNSSACPAEWLRYYDSKKTDGTDIDLQRVGLIAVGEMDIGRIGRIVVDAENGKFVDDETKYLHLEGTLGKADSGPHTWGVGLYTYDGMLSADKNVGEIKHIFWQAYGLSGEMLTEFIYDLYKDPKRNRIYSAEEMLEFTKKGAPFILECVETEGMSAIDHYCFPKDYFMWSLQFVPKKFSNPNLPDSLNGYILCTVIGQQAENEYFSEIWIFDANNLSKGPVCKLHHEKLIFAFTIHSVWVAQAGSVSVADYKLDIKADYNSMVKRIWKRKLRKRVQKLLDEHVYPNFN